jgi:hypothetical protein
VNTAIENYGRPNTGPMAGRTKVGGFPSLAETLRRAGVTRNPRSKNERVGPVAEDALSFCARRCL